MKEATEAVKEETEAVKEEAVKEETAPKNNLNHQPPNRTFTESEL